METASILVNLKQVMFYFILIHIVIAIASVVGYGYTRKDLDDTLNKALGRAFTASLKVIGLTTFVYYILFN